ncbi:phage holin family protein [Marivita sp. S2033]|uniref:phage holin family protein n=1 Tax=Marivita sp. S2033 TaxID=3373187 RepID=UPI00398205F0
MTHTPPPNEPTTIIELISASIADARALIRAEFALAKTEISDNVSRAGTGLVLFGIAALTAFVALNAFAVAAVFGVAALGVPFGWSALIVAIGFLVLAAIFALVGKSRLSVDALKPNRTIGQIKSDVHAMKEITRV